MCTKRRFLASLLAGAWRPAAEAFSGDPPSQAPTPALGEGRLPSLAGASSWLNSAPLTPSDLRGKVVLIDFWTYTCINWMRTLPYVRAWDQAYRRQGLVTIGVHTPEFDFERDPANVQRAVSTLRVPYPVAVDADSVIWRAFGNRFWPALYVVDAQGRIRHRRDGEGDQPASEQVVRQLLSEAGASDLGREPAPVEAHDLEAPADWAHLESEENYLGYRRTLHFASPGGIVRDRPHVYTEPARLALNAWSLAGQWTMTPAFAMLHGDGGRMHCRFHARDLHLVMTPPPSGSPLRFRVLLDGQPPAGDRGVDVEQHGFGTLAVPRLHQLIRQRGSIVDRQFEIQFLDAGARVYAITFG